jgi:hypothetical protein
MKLLNLTIVLFSFIQICSAQEVGNMKGSWLPKTETKISSNQATTQVDDFLKTLTGSFRPIICSANISFQLPPKSGCRTLTLLVKGANAKVGMSGMVIGK